VKPKITKIPIVEVEWGDAASGSRWCDIKDIEEQHNKGYPVKSIGYLAKKDKRGVTLSIAVGCDDDTYLGHHFIPAGMIKRIRKLKG